MGYQKSSLTTEDRLERAYSVPDVSASLGVDLPLVFKAKKSEKLALDKAEAEVDRLFQFED